MIHTNCKDCGVLLVDGENHRHYTRARCTPCYLAMRRAYYKTLVTADPPKGDMERARRRALTAAWIRKNPDKAKAANQKWASKNPDKIRGYWRKYYYNRKMKNGGVF